MKRINDKNEDDDDNEQEPEIRSKEIQNKMKTLNSDYEKKN